MIQNHAHGSLCSKKVQTLTMLRNAYNLGYHNQLSCYKYCWPKTGSRF